MTETEKSIVRYMHATKNIVSWIDYKYVIYKSQNILQP